MKNTFFVFLFSTIPFVFFGQINGFVYDNNNMPIDGVDVLLVDMDFLIKTNDKGFFQFDQDITDNIYIQFSKYGYANKIIQYKKDQELNIILRKLHVELDEIGIQEKNSVLGNNKAINIEHKSIIDNFISSASLVENITQLPGLNSIGSGLGIQKVVIRGLSGLRVVSYLNGMKIANQEWANDHGIGFTDLGLANVELIKGASSLKYGGDAVGGILYFKDAPFVKSNTPSGFIASKFDDSHFLFSNQFGVKWSNKNLYINAYGQYSISSDYRLPNNTYLYNSRFRNQSYKLSVGHLGNKMHNIFRYQYHSEQLGIPAHVHGDLNTVTLESLTLNSLNFNTDFELTRPTQFVNNHLFTFESKYFSNRIKYIFFAGHFLNNLQEFDKWTIAAFDMDLSTSTLRLNLEIPLQHFSVNSGMQYQRQQNYNNIYSRLIPDAQSNDYSVYTTVDYNKNFFGFSSGLRLDYRELTCDDFNYNQSFSSLNSSIGLFYKRKSHISRISYAGSYRAPHLSELFSNGLHHGTMRFEIGNINLDIEKSHQFDFKYQWNNDHIGIVVNPFIQFVTDFISINPSDSVYQSTYPIYNYVQFNQVNLSGCEFKLHFHPHFMHNIHIEQSYSFIHAVNKESDSFLALVPANKIKTQFNLDLNNYNLPLGLKSLKLYHLYSFKQDNVAPYEIVSSSYNILNMALVLTPFNSFSASAGINNILNKEYVPHLSRIRDVAGGVPNPGRSFYLSLKYDF